MKKCIVVTIVLVLLFAFPASAAKCPHAFKLSGPIDTLWKHVTDNAWNNMLPPYWIDKGFHFYSRVRERGPEEGINTPSDLETEIRKGHDQPAAPPADRRQIILPIVNSKGDHLKVIYDYDGRKHSKCQLVTLTY